MLRLTHAAPIENQMPKGMHQLVAKCGDSLRRVTATSGNFRAVLKSEKALVLPDTSRGREEKLMLVWWQYVKKGAAIHILGFRV